MRDSDQSVTSSLNSSGVSMGSIAGGGDSGVVLGIQGRPRPPKLYRIGEIIDYSGLSRQTIHNYATMGLLRESQWTRGGHRLFDESVFERLDQVLLMKRDCKSMHDIREHFLRLDDCR